MEREEPIAASLRGRDPSNPSNRNTRGLKLQQALELGGPVSNTVTSVHKDALVAEPRILTPRRTEYGKAVRKEYDSGQLKAKRKDMTSLEPRQDGTSNTITTAQKDNLLQEPLPPPKEPAAPTRYRIRNLTEREVLRLMDVDEPFIDRMLISGVSKSQVYKAAGNSIVVACMAAIFQELFTPDNTKPHADEMGQLSLF